MKKFISFSLILSLGSSLIFPFSPSMAENIQTAFLIDDTEESLVSQRRGGGRRGGGGGRSRASRSSGGKSSFNRSKVGSNGSNRVKRSSSNRSRSNRSASNRRGENLHKNRNYSNRVNKDKTRERARNIDRNQVNSRINNVDRRKIDNRINNVDRRNVRNRIDNSRNFNIDNNRRYSNRINRNIVNTGNRNIIVNPRGGWGGWGWNGGSRWYPNYGYWGGGFWGTFAVGAVVGGVTGALINEATRDDSPDVVVIQQNSPGYQLFDSYGLTQVQCRDLDDTLVYIYGPQDSLICAYSNNLVDPGYYDVDPEGLVLIAR